MWVNVRWAVVGVGSMVLAGGIEGIGVDCLRIGGGALSAFCIRACIRVNIILSAIAPVIVGINPKK